MIHQTARNITTMAATGKLRTFVAGVGMTKFSRPLTRDWDYPDIGAEAAGLALHDAGLEYSDVDAVVASYVYGESTSGQRAVYQLGLTGLPVFNVNNNCSSASSGLMLARSLVRGGYKCVLALGFEKMGGSGLLETFPDRTSPIHRHTQRLAELGAEPGPVKPGFNNFTSDVIKMFAYAAREYREKHGKMTSQLLAQVALKNRRHGYNNPNASLTSQTTFEKILDKSREICEPITSGMCALTADGGAAAIVCNEDFLKSRDHRTRGRAVEIIGQQMVTDLASSFHGDYRDVCGYSMSRLAAERCYRESGLGVRDVHVAEVHDCFSCNEVFMYEALNMAPEGQGCDLFSGGKWTRNNAGEELYQLGGRWVVNPSGGLESKGHPIGATGLGQCTELVNQLRGEAGKRQVDNARVGLQHNFGIGGAAVVTMYQKPGVTSKL